MSQQIQLAPLCQDTYGVSLADCSNEQIYALLVKAVQDMTAQPRIPTKTPARRLYYLCAEFLLGRLLTDRMIHLGIYDSIREQLQSAGKSLDLIAQQEQEPSLGNGGLGRLAACFLDSIASLGLPGDGIGLLYHFGLFRQRFSQLQQMEIPDPWLDRAVFLKKQPFALTVPCLGQSLRACMYDLDVLGENGYRNTLHLFDVDSVSEEDAPNGEIRFDMQDIAHRLTWFLYPDDSTAQGRRLRLCQQYFLASCAAAWILDDCRARGWQVGEQPLHQYAVIQINDTHPALIIPVLIQRLCELGVEETVAYGEVRACCAYTNHTVMSEALERWHLQDVEAVAPALSALLRRMDGWARAHAEARGVDPDRVGLILGDQLAMAHLAAHFSDHINGVAELHTTLLRTTVLADFYRLYPERFSNKTNGITHRRWLLACNPTLTRWIAERIGNGFFRDASQLSELEKYARDSTALQQLWQIKQENKQRLCRYLQQTRGLSLMPQGIFDVQIKRLHEYKRQHLSALYLIDRLLSLREGAQMDTPLVAIFGAKAAASYEMAKDILHLLLCLQALTQQDACCRGVLQVVVVENYNVEAAEYLMPAAEISEQISLASKEASGTGNMKMMMNGALTLGTLDGANIEIMQRVGEENMFLFGMTGEEVVRLEDSCLYDPQLYYREDTRLRRAVDFLVSEEMLRLGNADRLKRLHHMLCKYDRFMSFADFAAYCECRDRALCEYRDREKWAKKMLLNISRSGYFSSDRTILEYDRDIWHLQREGE